MKVLSTGAVALLAMALVGAGCGGGSGSGSGPAANPTAQYTVVESAPRSVSGIMFLQQADRATYRTGQAMHLTFYLYNPPGPTASHPAAYSFSASDFQPVQFELTSGQGGNVLVPRTPPDIGASGSNRNLYTVTQGTVYGFQNDTPAPAPGTYTLSAWSLATSTDEPGLDPPASALQTTLYANPITIRVTP